MNEKLRQDAQFIVKEAIRDVQPDAAVTRALAGREFAGRVILVAAGKAAWQMAKAAQNLLKDKIETGIVVAKYNHVMGELPGIACYEGGHPVPDEGSFRGT